MTEFGNILRIFLWLGLTSFGGPTAHIGYFRRAFVVRRGWLDEAAYADLVALCQFLPGPASSQVGFALGLMRGGYAGAFAAWAGFTLPSAILMMLFASVEHAAQGPLGDAAIHGLKLAAVAIVAQALWGMARALCPDRTRAMIAVLAVVVVQTLGPEWQIAALLLGGVVGYALCGEAATVTAAPIHSPVSRSIGIAALGCYGALFLVLPLFAAATGFQSLRLFTAVYRAGALVFGGGHVVLPLLHGPFVESGWMTDATFLAGYGAAQAVPGPLFTIGAYLGYAMGPQPHGLVGAALGLVGLFLPGLLVLVGTLPFWSALSQWAAGRAVMAGLNATVVGLLGAALYDPLWTGTVAAPQDVGLAVVAFTLLTHWRAPPLLVVALCVTASVAETGL